MALLMQLFTKGQEILYHRVEGWILPSYLRGSDKNNVGQVIISSWLNQNDREAQNPPANTFYLDYPTLLNDVSGVTEDQALTKIYDTIKTTFFTTAEDV